MFVGAAFRHDQRRLAAVGLSLECLGGGKLGWV